MSTRYNTGNPIESTDVRDMSDNAKNFDEFSNSTSDSFTDRLGRDRQTIEGSIRKAGFQPASFDFVTGGTLVSGDRNKAVFNPSPTGDNNWYAWQGALPKTISPNSTPSTSGGLGDNAWKPVTNNILATTVRESIRRSYAEAGYNLVDGSFEAGGSVATATDVLLYEAEGKAYSYTGTLPRTVTEDSAPSDEPGMWVDKSHVRNKFDVRDYLVSGDGVTDDTVAFQNAIDGVYAAGGGTLEIPANMRIKLTSLLYGRRKVSIKCDPTSWLDFRGAGWLTPTNNLALLGYYGSAGSFIVPLADMVVGSNKISVPDTSVFKVGGMIELSMDDAGKWQDTSTVVTAGQLAIVTAVYPTTNNIVISEPIYETLTLAKSARIRIINPIEDVVIDGLGIIGNGRNPAGNAEQGLKVFFGRNIKIKNCRLKDVDTQSIGVISCYGAEISHNRVDHPPLGTVDVISYGIAYSSSMHVKIHDNHGINARHGIISSHLARSYGYYGINRFVDIHDNIHTSNYGDLGSAGFARAHGGIATHTDAEFINVYDNTVVGCRYGINIRTANNKVSGNKVHDCPVGIYLSEYWANMEISDNEIYDCTQPFYTDSTPYEVSRGVIEVHGNKMTRCGGSAFTFPATVKSKLIFNDNSFVQPSNTGVTATVSVYNNVDFTAAGNNFDVNDTLAIRAAATSGMQIVTGNFIQSLVPYNTNQAIYVVSSVNFVIRDNIIVSPTGATSGGIACPTRLVAPNSVVTNNHLVEV